MQTNNLGHEKISTRQFSCNIIYKNIIWNIIYLDPLKTLSQKLLFERKKIPI